jgi:hypothetical protein
MATTTHTLDGPDLERLLARVPAELGPDAVIVAANKLRTGGVGGFFAKEAFEVVVEVPEAGRAAEADPPEGELPPAASGTTTTAPSLPRVSTEAAGFAGVLERMVRDAGIEDAGPRAVGPLLTRPEAPAEPFEPLQPARVEPATIPAPAPAAAPAPTAAPPTVAPTPAVMPSISPALDQRWLARIGLPTNVAARLTTVSHDPAIELLHLMEQVTRPEPLPTGQGSVIAVVGRRADALEVCAQFAAQLGLNPEDVLVAAATFRGASVSEDRRISSIELAHERRRSWRRRPGPTIVAVDTPPAGARSGWAAHLLDAVEPTMVWGVVEASRKAEDIRDWARRLGGLDALAVTGLDDTVSPATVLGAGVPVGLLDGHEASASRWTAVLCEHLEVAA